MFWPFTVWGFLKPNFRPHEYWISRTCCCNSTYRSRYWNATTFCSSPKRSMVATVLTVHGIETYWASNLLTNFTVATVLTVHGIETNKLDISYNYLLVATVLTVHGIETLELSIVFLILFGCNSTYRLRYWNTANSLPPSIFVDCVLQQCLPFTVLKLSFAADSSRCCID